MDRSSSSVWIDMDSDQEAILVMDKAEDGVTSAILPIIALSVTLGV